MSKALITTLSRKVEDKSLPKLGELKIYADKGTLDGDHRLMRIESSAKMSITIDGGTFVEENNLSNSIGTTLSFEKDQLNSVGISNDTSVISIISKYSLTHLQLGSDLYADFNNLSFSKNLKKLSGGNTKNSLDIKILKDFQELTTIWLPIGDIRGDISELSGLSNIEQITIYSKDITGKIESLKSCRKLKEVVLNHTSVGGDVSQLGGLTDLKVIKLSVNTEKVTGDLSKMGMSFYHIQADNGTPIEFTWKGNRSSDYPIINIIGNANFGEDLDAMLINQAKCQKPDDVSNLKIQAIGTRTSASDAAVATLQSKGYTVSITPA